MNLSGYSPSAPFEPLVDAEAAGQYLGFSAVKVRQMAREGKLPCVPFPAGSRTVWRFRMSDLQEHVQKITKGVESEEKQSPERFN